MWHEARKQERKIRGMLVDYRRRAERRQDFYEKIKADPTQFMQIHGRKCKIHLDPAIAMMGDGGAIIVPWQGQKDNLIDRFDVRAHLDFIPTVQKIKELENITLEERQCNYERYRILAQNDFLCISEEKYLHQLYLDEQFGANAQIELEQRTNKKSVNPGAAIGYTYDDSESSASFNQISNSIANSSGTQVPASYDEDDDSESDVDMDVSIEINKLDNNQAHDLNTCGRNYGMMSNDFYSFLVKDADEADALRMAREEEQEKMMLSGRKSRRERRAQRERRCIGRPLSPPSYAAKNEKIDDEKQNDSDSRSPSPENSGKITYITSFGGEDELQPHSKITISLNNQQHHNKALENRSGIHRAPMSYADKVKENLSKLKYMNDSRRSFRKDSSNSPKKPKQYIRSRSRSRSRSYYRKRRSRSSSGRSRSNSRNRYKYRRYRYRNSRSNSGSRKCISRSKSRYSKRQSRSNSPIRKYRSRSRSRSRHTKQRKNDSRHRRYTSSSSSSSSYRQRSDRYRRKRSKSPNERNVGKEMKIRPQSRTISKVNISVDTAEPSSLINKNVQQSLTKNDITTNLTAHNEPSLPVKRYYGRKRDNASSSSSSSSPSSNSENDENCSTQNTISEGNAVVNSSHRVGCSSIASATHAGYSESTTGNSLSNIGKSAIEPITPAYESKQNTGICSSAVNPRDRLKRKMQILLNKQYKADKKAEIERIERQIKQQNEREDEMRELALKLRRRQRELRHKYGTPSNSEDEDISQSPIANEDNNPVIQKNPIKYSKRSKSKSYSSSSSSSSSSPPRITDKDRSRPKKRSSSRSKSRDRLRQRDRSNYRDRNYYSSKPRYEHKSTHSAQKSRSRRIVEY